MTAKKVIMLCTDYREDYEAMVLFQALQAYCMFVDAASSGKKAGDACRTAVHQPTGGRRRKLAGSTRERAKISVGRKEIP
ncbi:protein DJ-1D [Hordeum vulgare]|nr:protein DJ-1D [Hordeum vulgare]